MFPLASHTFTVLRRNQTTMVGNNLVPAGPATIGTGLPVTLKDQSANIATEKGGTVFNALYIGTASKTATVQIGDLLQDETENAPDGQPVEYEVQGLTRNALFLRLHLRRTDIGV